MTQHNVGALVVVRPGEQNAVAGIITERGTRRHKLMFLIPLYAALSNHVLSIKTYCCVLATKKKRLLYFWFRH